MTLLTEGRNEMDSYPTAMTTGAYWAVIDRLNGDVIGRFVTPEAAAAVAATGNALSETLDRFRCENTMPAHLRHAS